MTRQLLESLEGGPERPLAEEDLAQMRAGAERCSARSTTKGEAQVPEAQSIPP